MKICFTIIILILNAYNILSSIIGIDLGSEFIKVSLFHPKKPSTMVENIQSKTKTPFAISFKNDERMFGAEALVRKSKSPNQVFTFMHDFLGKSYDDEQLGNFIKDFFVSYKIEKDEQRSSIVFKINYNKTTYQLSPEEIYGMMFRYIKFFSSKYAEVEITQCLVSVPSFFTYKQRLALIQGIEISTLKLLRLVNDNVAAAIKYSIDNTFNNKNEKFILFYNMGASYTQTSLVSFKSVFQGTKSNLIEHTYIKVNDEVWDKTLGGRNFDFRIVRHILDLFNKSRNVSNTENENRKAMRILPSAVKIKEILSSNKEIPVHILGVEDGANYEGFLTRKEFEEFSKEDFDKVPKPLTEILQNNPTVIQSDIATVEFIGGGHRIPKIKEILKETLPDEKLGHHMNGDDAIALGLAFLAGNYTNNYLPKKRIFLDGEGSSYYMRIEIENPSVEEYKGKYSYCEDQNSNTVFVNCIRQIKKDTVIFSPRQGYNIDKKVNFKHDGDFDIRVYESLTKDDQGSHLITFKIRKIIDHIIPLLLKEETFTKNIPRVKLFFNLDKFGLLTLKAELNYEVYTYLTMTKDKKGKIEFKYTSKKTEPLTEDVLEKEINEIKESKDYSKLDKEKIPKQLKDVGTTRQETRVKALEIIVEHTAPFPLDKTQIINSKVKLNNFDQIDKDRIEKADIRNTIENNIFSKHEWIESSEAHKTATVEELEKFNQGLKEIEEWYEAHGRSASKGEIEKKNERINSLFRIFSDRKETNRKREIAVDYFRSEMRSSFKEATNLVNNRPWIEQTFNSTFKEYYDSLNMWIEEKVSEQEKLNDYDKPILTEDMIYQRLDELRAEVKKLKRIPRPIIEITKGEF